MSEITNVRRLTDNSGEAAHFLPPPQTKEERQAELFAYEEGEVRISNERLNCGVINSGGY